MTAYLTDDASEKGWIWVNPGMQNFEKINKKNNKTKTLMWINLVNPGMQNFEKETKKQETQKKMATSPDIKVVVETLFFLFFFGFFGSLQSKGRRKSRVNPRVFAGLSTAKTTILQFGLDDCAVRVGWFCSSGWTADSRHWLLSISNASSYLHRLLWAQKNMKPSIVSRLHIPKMSFS